MKGEFICVIGVALLAEALATQGAQVVAPIVSGFIIGIGLIRIFTGEDLCV